MKMILFADGGARGNPGPAAAGVVLKNSKNETLATISNFLGTATNNQAEYAGVILGVKKALELSATELDIYLDSKLIVEQVSGRWKIKDLELKKLAEKVHAGLEQLGKWQIHHIPREKNREADLLANQALDKRGFIKSQKYKVQGQKFGFSR